MRPAGIRDVHARDDVKAVLIVDDHPVVRRGLRQTLEDEIRDAVFGEAGNAEQTLLAVARRPWDIVLLDIGIPDRDGFQILRDILLQHPETKVLLLSECAERRYAIRARQAGARGYISIDASLSELRKAVRNVLAGKQYFGRTLSDRVEPGPADPPRAEKPTNVALSAREHEVLLAVAVGKGIGEIATELKLSIKTASTYKRRVLNKLHLNSTADLVRYVMDHRAARPES